MKRVLQFLAMVGLLLVITFACQREENELLEEEKGISLQEAKQFFEKNIQGLLSGFTPNWKTYKEWNNEEVAYVYASNPVADAHILFVKNKGRLGFNGLVLQGDDIFNINAITNINEETKVNKRYPHYTEEEKQILAKMTYLGQAIYCDMC
ncbi:MAG: hypothetical protein Q4A09_03540 [Capnocytophaga felis]|nr:hypothetical protein [Capnocytophaga felis]